MLRTLATRLVSGRTAPSTNLFVSATRPAALSLRRLFGTEAEPKPSDAASDPFADIGMGGSNAGGMGGFGGRRSSFGDRRSQQYASRKTVTPGKPRDSGTVKWFDATKGFGFITRDNGTDVFVHYSSIVGEGYRSLEEGQKVQFTMGKGQRGEMADEVTLNTA